MSTYTIYDIIYALNKGVSFFMFKCAKNIKAKISLVLVVALLASLTACGQQGTPLEKVMPNFQSRVYDQTDLMSANGKILTRARVELVTMTQDYYDKNEIISAPDSSTDEEKADFIAKIMTMGWNLKVMQNKLSTYTDNDLKAYNRLKKDRATLKFLKQNGYDDKDGLDDYYFVISYPEAKEEDQFDPENMGEGKEVTFTQEEMESMGYTENFPERLAAYRASQSQALEESRRAKESEEALESAIDRDHSEVADTETTTAADASSDQEVTTEAAVSNDTQADAAASSDEQVETAQMVDSLTGQTYSFIDNTVDTTKNEYLDMVDDKYYNVEFNLYKPVIITPEQYNSLEVGDTIDLEMQEISKRDSNKTYTFTKKATNSFIVTETRKDEEGNPVLDDEEKEIEDTYEFAFLPNRDSSKYKLYYLARDNYMPPVEGEEPQVYPVKIHTFAEKRTFRVLKGARCSHTESQAYLAFNQYNELNNSVYATIEEYYDNHYYGINNVMAKQGGDIRKAYDEYQARNVFMEAIYGNRIFFNDKGYVTGMHYEMALE